MTNTMHATGVIMCIAQNAPTQTPLHTNLHDFFEKLR